MILCHCRSLTDRDIRRTVREGAHTRRTLLRRCGAGGVCGGCWPVIDEILAEECPQRSDTALGSLELAPAP